VVAALDAVVVVVGALVVVVVPQTYLLVAGGDLFQYKLCAGILGLCKLDWPLHAGCFPTLAAETAVAMQAGSWGNRRRPK
jgi:hypothetical protein